MFASPLAVVPASRIVLLPAVTLTVTVLVTHVVHAPVPGKDTADAAVAPLTRTLAGRSVVVPLAKRMPRVAEPAFAAFTVHCTNPPTALVVLQNPVPENPAQFESIVPSHCAGAFSDS
jgi:hypothetical protein